MLSYVARHNFDYKLFAAAHLWADVYGFNY